MTRAQPGRNDPCHCGSGRKYKRCHLEADEAAARAARVPREVKPELFADPRLSKHAGPIGRALKAITEHRLEELPLSAIREMLAKGGTLAALRFDATHFRETMAKQLPKAPSGDEPWRALWEEVAPALAPAPERTRERWLDLLLARMEGTASTPESNALAAAAAMLLVGRLAHDLPVQDQPFFDEVFLAQLTELAGSEEQLKAVVENRAAPQRAGLGAIGEKHPTLAAQLSEVAPALASGAPADEAGALERVRRAIGSDKPPPVLALDELLWLESRFAEVIASTRESTDPEALRRARSEATVALLREAAEEFGEAARDRAARLAVDARLSEEARSLARDLVTALGAAPAKVLLALVHAPQRPVQWRSGLERKAFQGLAEKATGEGLAEYANWLEQANELDAAVRVRDVRARSIRR